MVLSPPETNKTMGSAMAETRGRIRDSREREWDGSSCGGLQIWLWDRVAFPDTNTLRSHCLGKTRSAEDNNLGKEV